MNRIQSWVFCFLCITVCPVIIVSLYAGFMSYVRTDLPSLDHHAYIVECIRTSWMFVGLWEVLLLFSYHRTSPIQLWALYIHIVVVFFGQGNYNTGWMMPMALVGVGAPK